MNLKNWRNQNYNLAFAIFLLVFFILLLLYDRVRLSHGLRIHKILSNSNIIKSVLDQIRPDPNT